MTRTEMLSLKSRPRVYNTAASTANISATNLLAGAPAGMYRISAECKVTRAATTSSTLPSVALNYTDGDTNSAINALALCATSTGNSLTTISRGSVVISVKDNTNIQLVTSGYVSSGATSLQYKVVFRVEYLG